MTLKKKKKKGFFNIILSTSLPQFQIWEVRFYYLVEQSSCLQYFKALEDEWITVLTLIAYGTVVLAQEAQGQS